MMKSIFSIIMITVVLCAGFTGCDTGSKTGKSSSLAGKETFDKDASYALGMSLGTSLLSDTIYPDMDEFVKGITDVLSESKTRFTMDNAMQILQTAFNTLTEQREAVNKQAENDYLAENSKKPGISVTPSGLQYEVISEGSGEKPTAEDYVQVHYEGTLTSGVVFDSSYNRGVPAEFPLGGVIPGWTEGLQLMSVGSKYRFYIPSDLGYGPQGAGQMIPPYSTLIFDVELLAVMHNH